MEPFLYFHSPLARENTDTTHEISHQADPCNKSYVSTLCQHVTYNGIQYICNSSIQKEMLVSDPKSLWHGY